MMSTHPHDNIQTGLCNECSDDASEGTLAAKTEPTAAEVLATWEALLIPRVVPSADENQPTAEVGDKMSPKEPGTEGTLFGDEAQMNSNPKPAPASVAGGTNVNIEQPAAENASEKLDATSAEADVAEAPITLPLRSTQLGPPVAVSVGSNSSAPPETVFSTSCDEQPPTPSPPAPDGSMPSDDGPSPAIPTRASATPDVAQSSANVKVEDDCHQETSQTNPAQQDSSSNPISPQDNREAAREDQEQMIGSTSSIEAHVAAVNISNCQQLPRPQQKPRSLRQIEDFLSAPTSTAQQHTLQQSTGRPKRNHNPSLKSRENAEIEAKMERHRLERQGLNNPRAGYRPPTKLFLPRYCPLKAESIDRGTTIADSQLDLDQVKGLLDKENLRMPDQLSNQYSMNKLGSLSLSEPGTLLSCLLFKRDDGSVGIPTFDIIRLVTDPAWQRKGCATRCVEAFVSLLRGSFPRARVIIRADVLKRDKAREFYLKLGFQQGVPWGLSKGQYCGQSDCDPYHFELKVPAVEKKCGVNHVAFSPPLDGRSAARNVAFTTDIGTQLVHSSAKNEAESNSELVGNGPFDYRTTGVRQTRSGKWQVDISYKGTTRFIGLFDTQDHATVANRTARTLLEATKSFNLTKGDIERNVGSAKAAARNAVANGYGRASSDHAVVTEDTACLNTELPLCEEEADHDEPKLRPGPSQSPEDLLLWLGDRKMKWREQLQRATSLHYPKLPSLYKSHPQIEVFCSKHSRLQFLGTDDENVSEVNRHDPNEIRDLLGRAGLVPLDNMTRKFGSVSLRIDPDKLCASLLFMRDDTSSALGTRIFDIARLTVGSGRAYVALCMDTFKTLLRHSFPHDKIIVRVAVLEKYQMFYKDAGFVKGVPKGLSMGIFGGYSDCATFHLLVQEPPTTKAAAKRKRTEHIPTCEVGDNAEQDLAERGIAKRKSVNSGGQPAKIALARIPSIPGLPEGWVVRSVSRRNSDRIDTYWFSPQQSYKFRSILEVTRFLENLERAGGDEVAAMKMSKRCKREEATLSLRHKFSLTGDAIDALADEISSEIRNHGPSAFGSIFPAHRDVTAEEQAAGGEVDAAAWRSC